MLALEFIDHDADAAMADATAATAWLAARRIRSALPAGSEPALADLRAAIENLLQAAAGDRQPSSAALDLINAASAAAPVADQIDWPQSGRPRRWLSTSASPEAHVHALLARSAMELVASEAGASLRACQAPGCGRLFVAGNARRRWCSTACGNRVRVARHAARQRADR